MGFMSGMRQWRGVLALAGIAGTFVLGGTAQAATPGQLDRSFGKDGIARTHLAGSVDPDAVAIDSKGRIVVAGSTCHSSPCVIAIARYKPNGTLDESFRGDGTARTHFAGLDQINAMAIDAQNRIVVAGRTCSGDLVTTCSFALARYKPNGTLDSSFDGDGKLTTKFGGGANAVTIDSENRIVAVGWASDFTTNQVSFGLARYKPNGTLDPSFSGDGKATTAFGATGRLYTYNAFAGSMGIDSHGRIVVGGTRVNADEEKYSSALARYLPDGSLDNSFSGNGKLTRPTGSCCEVAIDAQDRIVVGGGGLIRYKTDGTLDRSFGGDGKVKNVEVRQLAIDSRGGIVAVSDHHLARRKPNGRADRSFGDDGEVTIRFHRRPHALDFATSEAIDAQDRIVVGGVSRKCVPSCTDDLVVARYIGY
jgi:serralysin